MKRIVKYLATSSSHPGTATLKNTATSLFFLCVLFTTSPLNAGTHPPGDDGLLVGSGRLHAFVEAESHYVYNPHRASLDAAADIRETKGPMLAIRPGLNYKALSSIVEIQLQSLADLRYYTADYLAGNNNFFGNDTRLGLLLNKDSTLPLRISAGYLRSDVPANQTISRSLLNRTLSLGLDGEWKPGGGAFTVRFKAPASKISYDAEENANHEKLNNLRVQPSLRVAWKFFPKTAFTLDLFSDLTQYEEGSYSKDIDFFGGSLGLTGAITSRISAVIRAGFSTPILASDLASSASGFVGLFELGYKLSNALSVSLATGREMRATPLFNYHKDIFGSLAASLNIGSQVNINLNFEARTLTFGTPTTSETTGFAGRNDLAVKPNLIISYFANNWLTISLHNRYEYRDTGDFTISMLSGEATGSYNYYDTFLRISARY